MRLDRPVAVRAACIPPRGHRDSRSESQPARFMALMPGGAVRVRGLGLALFIGLFAAPSLAADFELIVLGAAQDGGLPHLGCERACCVTARATGAGEDPTCLAVHDRETGSLVLLEATPRIETQIARLHALTGITGRHRQPVDAVLLTHAHMGHYLGLAHFGFEVASTKSLPVWGSERMCDYLGTNGPWSQLVRMEQLVPRAFDPGVPFSPVAGLSVIAIPVPHRDEYTDTGAYKLTGGRGTVLFVPDVDRWDRHDDLLERLLEGVDVAYLDATFYDGRELPERNLKDIPHPLMVDTMDRLQDVARERPGAIRFIHLNHTNPALTDSTIRAGVEARGFGIARTGDRLPF